MLSDANTIRISPGPYSQTEGWVVMYLKKMGWVLCTFGPQILPRWPGASIKSSASQGGLQWPRRYGVTNLLTRHRHIKTDTDFPFCASKQASTQMIQPYMQTPASEIQSNRRPTKWRHQGDQNSILTKRTLLYSTCCRAVSTKLDLGALGGAVSPANLALSNQARWQSEHYGDKGVFWETLSGLWGSISPPDLARSKNI